MMYNSTKWNPRFFDAKVKNFFGLLLIHLSPRRIIPTAGIGGGEPHPESGAAAARDRVGPADRHHRRPAHHPQGAQRGGQGAEAQVEAGQCLVVVLKWGAIFANFMIQVGCNSQT